MLATLIGLMFTVHYNPDAAMLAQVMYYESGNLPTDEEKAGVAWCVLNRVDSEDFPDDIYSVLTQENQFSSFSVDNPVREDLYELADEVLKQWEKEKNGESIERPLPQEYVFYWGDGETNYYRTSYGSDENYEIGG